MAIIRHQGGYPSGGPDGAPWLDGTVGTTGSGSGALQSWGSFPGVRGLPDFVAGEVLVKLVPGATDGLAAASNATITMDADAFGIQLWRLPQGLSVEAAIKGLSENPLIELVEPNYVISASAVPNDPHFSKLWGLNNIGQAYATSGGVPVTGTDDSDIDAPAAWDLGTASDVIVAVIDTGVNFDHPDLRDTMWRNPGEIASNGVDDDGNGFVDDYFGYDFHNRDGDPRDDNGHGTHVAGIIAAEGNNGIGVTGVAWTGQVMSLKFLNSAGNGLTSNAIAALNYAVENGASISNASWGGDGYSQLLADAIAEAGAAGHLIVAAAGNDGLDIEVSPHYPASYDADNVIAVAATDADDVLASYSNYGVLSVDLAAPGTNIYSTYGSSYGYMSGTSMAAPYVTGAAALIWSVNPSLTWEQVKDIILSTVDLLPSLDGKVATGGRLNLAAAVEAAVNVPEPTIVAASIAAADADKLEGSAGTTAFTFTVTLDEPAAEALSVNYVVSGSGIDAASGSDFLGGALPSGTASFAEGATSATITIQVVGDGAIETDEGFLVTLTDPSTGLSIDVGAASGVIRNDDFVPAGQTITGTAGANTLSGGEGDDTIYGLNGADRLSGLGGADLLDGGAGADTMIGGSGDDTYVVAQTSDVVTEAAGGGTDLVEASVAHTLASNVENLTLTGTANINGAGNTLANRIVGNAGKNTLLGNDGNDRLDGGADNDSLNGGNGDDTLVAGLGKDTLNGAAGRDVLVFDTALATDNRDIIVGFNATDDDIHLDNAVFAALGPDGALASNAFVTGAAATLASHRIVYNSSTKILSYDADGVGGGAAVQIATFSSPTGTISASDFWVI